MHSVIQIYNQNSLHIHIHLPDATSLSDEKVICNFRPREYKNHENIMFTMTATIQIFQPNEQTIASSKQSPSQFLGFGFES